MTKQYVFKQFVKGNSDTIGLVAYALYKYDKSQLADEKRKEGQSEEDISKEVATFHDQLSRQPQRIDSYKQQATALFSEMAEKIEKDQQDALKKEWRREKETFYKNVQRIKQENKSLFSKCVDWLLDGIKSVVSTAFVSALVLGLAAWTTSEQTKTKILTEALRQFIGTDASQAENQENTDLLK